VDAPNDLELIEQLLAGQPVEVMKRLARGFFSAAALRDRGLAERDAGYRGLAAGRVETSGYATAKAIRGEVERYRDRGAWRFDRGRAAPADPRRALAHRILTLDDGRVRSRSTVERALAGVRSNSGPQMNGRVPHASAPDEPRGRDEGAPEGDYRAIRR
jgi:hypothetical protein